MIPQLPDWLLILLCILTGIGALTIVATITWIVIWLFKHVRIV